VADVTVCSSFEMQKKKRLNDIVLSKNGRMDGEWVIISMELNRMGMKNEE